LTGREPQAHRFERWVKATPRRSPRLLLCPAAAGFLVSAVSLSAGIAPVAAHAMRHTLASELLRRGAGLPEIGQVLRHQSIETTAIYAKVDKTARSGLALPWPGSQS